MSDPYRTVDMAAAVDVMKRATDAMDAYEDALENGIRMVQQYEDLVADIRWLVRNVTTAEGALARIDGLCAKAQAGEFDR